MESLNWTRGMGAAACGLLVLMSIVVWWIVELVLAARRGALDIGIIGPSEGTPFADPPSSGDKALLIFVIPFVIVLVSTLPPYILGLSWQQSLVPALLAHVPWVLLVAVMYPGAGDSNGDGMATALPGVLMFGTSAGLNVLLTLLLLRPVPLRMAIAFCITNVLFLGAAAGPSSGLQDVAVILSLASWAVMPGVASLFVPESPMAKVHTQ